MVRMHDKPTEPLDTSHYIWHEIRVSSFLQSRQFPHAPFIQALIDQTTPFGIAKTEVHAIWKPPPHMRMAAPTLSAAPRQSRKSAGALQPTGSSVPSSSTAPRGRLA